MQYLMKDLIEQSTNHQYHISYNLDMDLSQIFHVIQDAGFNVYLQPFYLHQEIRFHRGTECITLHFTEVPNLKWYSLMALVMWDSNTGIMRLGIDYTNDIASTISFNPLKEAVLTNYINFLVKEKQFKLNGEDDLLTVAKTFELDLDTVIDIYASNIIDVQNLSEAVKSIIEATLADGFTFSHMALQMVKLLEPSPVEPNIMLLVFAKDHYNVTLCFGYCDIGNRRYFILQNWVMNTDQDTSSIFSIDFINRTYTLPLIDQYTELKEMIKHQQAIMFNLDFVSQ